MNAPPKSAALTTPKITNPTAGTTVTCPFKVEFMATTSGNAGYKFYLITGIPNDPTRVGPSDKEIKYKCEEGGKVCTGGSVENMDAPDEAGSFFLVLCDAKDNVLDAILLYRK